MARTVPKHDAKIGKKIDYLATELGDALQTDGFVRKARRLWRQVGEGEQQCFYVMELQGDKWNEGSWGKFCINIGVQFPSLIRHYAELSNDAWRAEGADEPDTALACPPARLDNALPAQREQWWAPEMDAAQDFWFEINADTNIETLAAVLCRAAREYLLPWFERNGSFEAIFASSSCGGQHHSFKLICGVRAGHREEARALFLENGSRWFRSEMFEKTKIWLERNGVEFGEVEFVPEPLSPHLATRLAAFDAARANATAMEQTLAQDSAPVGERVPQLLQAYHEACRTRDGENSTSPIWSLLERSDVDTRRLTIITIMQQLIGAATDIPSLRPNIWGSYLSYDGYWGELLNMLLKGLPCDEAFARALFANLPPLTQRFSRPGVFCLEFSDSLRHVVHYLCREARPWSDVLKPQVAHLLELIRNVAVADFDEMARSLQAASEASDQGPHLPLIRDEALRERQIEYPEQNFEKPDREAIAALRKWLNRDAEGRDIMLIENDDWGRQLSEALKTFPGDVSALMTMLEWFASAPPAKASPAFIKQVNIYIPAIAAEPVIAKVFDWLDTLLHSYAESDLKYEWATMTARPGVGAFAGETSGNILLGLIRFMQVWQAERFARAFAIVAEAGFTVIPEVRMRNQKAASAAVDAMGASASGRTLLQDMRARMKKPAIQKAIDAALAKAID